MFTILINGYFIGTIYSQKELHSMEYALITFQGSIWFSVLHPTTTTISKKIAEVFLSLKSDSNETISPILIKSFDL